MSWLAWAVQLQSRLRGWGTVAGATGASERRQGSQAKSVGHVGQLDKQSARAGERKEEGLEQVSMRGNDASHRIPNDSSYLSLSLWQQIDHFN